MVSIGCQRQPATIECKAFGGGGGDVTRERRARSAAVTKYFCCCCWASAGEPTLRVIERSLLPPSFLILSSL